MYEIPDFSIYREYGKNITELSLLELARAYSYLQEEEREMYFYTKESIESAIKEVEDELIKRDK